MWQMACTKAYMAFKLIIKNDTLEFQLLKKIQISKENNTKINK